MKLAGLYFLITLTTAKAFFFSSSDPVDCIWLPWKYMGCARVGDGDYRKVENRTKIEAINGGRDCAQGPNSRMTESCPALDYIASTVLSAISGRKESQEEVFVGANIPAIVGGREPPLFPILFDHAQPELFGSPTPSTTTSTTPTAPTTAPPSVPQSERLCAGTFTDPETGIKMLGADCTRRRRRRIDAPPAKLRVKRQFGGRLVSIEHRDVLFLLDESGSVGQTNFQKELKFVKILAQKFCFPRQIGREETRVAVATFSTDPTNPIEFGDSYDYGDFRRALGEIRYRSEKAGSTCLIKALRAARNEMFTTRKGSRVRLGTTDGLLILITDGCLNCFTGDASQELQAEQKAFEKLGISILTYMVKVGGSCERSYKALQDGSSCFRGFSFPSWAQFESHTSSYENFEGCINQWKKNSQDCP